MIQVTRKDGETVKIDCAINRGEWFGKTWLITIGCGFSGWHCLVEAGDENDAIDAIVDSSRADMLKTDVKCDACEAADKLEDPPEGSWDDCECILAGNYGERIDADAIVAMERIYKVDYFAKPVN